MLLVIIILTLLEVLVYANGPPGTVYDECGYCVPHCGASLNYCDIVKLPCKPGYYCQRGWKLDGHRCVPGNLCPVPECNKRNEQYYECGNPCIDLCASCAKEVACTLQCVPGCYCKKGFKKVKGICQKAKRCPKICCPDNEIYKLCPTGMNNSTSACGCVCKPGYVRDASKKCVQCEDKGLVFRECGNPCTEECGGLPCPEICLPGCYCPDGYKRWKGECIPQRFCIFLDENNEPRCGKDLSLRKCENSCKTQCLASKCLAKCPGACKLGCYCPDGTKRKGNQCISDQECEATLGNCTGAHKVFRFSNTCINKCPPVGKPQKCTKIAEYGCFCKENYRLNIYGECVRENECPKNVEPDPINCRQLGLVYNKCGNNCTQYCGSICPEIPVCVPGCYCPEGYKLWYEECISQKFCPIGIEQNKCGKELVYKDCENSCHKICQSADCIASCLPSCKKGCYCPKGLKRLGDQCVPEKSCECQGDHRVLKFSNSCLNKCPNKEPRFCPEYLIEGCFCEDQYLENKDKICVQNCPSEPKCPGINEAYTDCGNRCQELCLSKRPRFCTLECQTGCFCKPGFLRHEGICVGDKECPICPLNETTHAECGNNCTELCPYPPTGIQCPLGCTRDNSTCFCLEGYKRITANGPCVLEKDCPKPPTCSGFNEEYTDCGNRCFESCPTGPKVCPFFCISGCFCKPGYLKYEGTCIPEQKCPVCPQNETTHPQCGNSCLEVCPYPAMGVRCETSCHNSSNASFCYTCFCRDGYKRIAFKGPCVLEEDCPKPPGMPMYKHNCTEPNMIWKDSNLCLNLCPTIPVIKCEQYMDKGCFCKDGYLMNLSGKCVPKYHCPKVPTCRENEDYTICGSRCEESCPKCPGFEPILNRREEGCFCKPNYKRMNGKCIDEKNCPLLSCLTPK